MLFSFAMIILVGVVFAMIMRKLGLPNLLGYLLAGIILGPFVFNVIDTTTFQISSDIRQIALMIILMRAGLNLKISDLKKVGPSALLMCFVPASFEILGLMILAPIFLHLDLLNAAILGTVLAAVSPAVVVPLMLKLMDEGYGTKEGIPQLIMAGASMDDVYVIVLFTSLLTLAKSGEFNALSLLRIPTSILFGIVSGIVIGYVLCKFYRLLKLSTGIELASMFAIGMVLITIERMMTGVVGFSGLLAIMALTATIRHIKPEMADTYSAVLAKLWQPAEIFLFALVGASVRIDYAVSFGPVVLIVIILALLFRMLGVYLSIMKTKFNSKEKIFTMIAYIPKATVQAAIGGLALEAGLASGELILTAAVTAILVTAPLGAIFISLTYRNFLQKA